MKHYETVFILNPVLSEDQVKEAVKGFEDFITSNNAEIVVNEFWGLKKLAYAIQKKKTGFYNLIEFKTENSELVSKLELVFKRDEKIMRYLTVSMDKHALDYSVKRREKLSNNKKS